LSISSTAAVWSREFDFGFMGMPFCDEVG